MFATCNKEPCNWPDRPGRRLSAGLLALWVGYQSGQAEPMTQTYLSETAESLTSAVPSSQPRRIVVGVDGSDRSRLALRWAQVLATATGSTIDAVLAWEYPPMANGWAAVPPDWHANEDAEKALNETVDAVFGADRPVGLQLVVREGHAARVLLEASAGAQMLVVGSRGHGGFVGLLLGSVSANCAEHAPCSVLVVHGDELPVVEFAKAFADPAS
jgi:nucleotide-binding universal stress UspA family protein